MTLEQQLADLIRKHGLCHISLNATVNNNNIMFYVNAQSIDLTDRHCGSSGYDCTAFADAIPGAINALNAKRSTTDALAPIEGLAA